MSSTTPPPILMGDQFYTSGPSRTQMHHHDLYHANSLSVTQSAPHHWQTGYFSTNQGSAAYYQQ